MDPFSGFNPWLVLGAAVFIGFVLGRISCAGRPDRPVLRQGRPRVVYRPFSEIDETGEAEVRELFSEEGKIAAIKRYRELTGAGLKEAKDAVEEMTER